MFHLAPRAAVLVFPRSFPPSPLLGKSCDVFLLLSLSRSRRIPTHLSRRCCYSLFLHFACSFSLPCGLLNGSQPKNMRYTRVPHSILHHRFPDSSSRRLDFPRRPHADGFPVRPLVDVHSYTRNEAVAGCRKGTRDYVRIFARRKITHLERIELKYIFTERRRHAGARWAAARELGSGVPGSARKLNISLLHPLPVAVLL